VKFVLIHGAWHTGEHWQPVADHLRAAGHEVHTPTVAGHGKNVNKAVSHADGVQSVVDYLREHDLKDVVLLGHSYGGTIISAVVQAVPERVRRLIYQNAFVLRDGESLLDAVSPMQQAIFRQLAATSDDNTVMLPFDVWREAFINDADLALAQSAFESLSPEPFCSFADKLDLKKFYTLDTPRSYLNCTEDIALPPGETSGWHPRLSSRLGIYRLVQIPGSHEVLFTAPERLAGAIVEAGRD